MLTTDILLTETDCWYRVIRPNLLGTQYFYYFIW